MVDPNPVPQPQAADAQLQPQDMVAAVHQMQGMIAQQQQVMQQQQQAIQALQQQLAAAAAQVPPAPAPAPPQPPQAPARPTIKVPKPDHFTGSKPTALTSWLLYMRNFLETQNVNLATQDAVRYAAAYLQGPALEWYHLQQQQTNAQVPYADFAAFQQALQRYLLPVDPSHTARQAMDRLKQRTSAQQYVTAFNTLLLQLTDMSERDRVHNFLKGLKPEVYKQISAQGPKTLSDAMEAAIRVDTAWYAASKVHYGSTSGQPSHGPAPMELGSVQADLRAITGCYKCGKEGHYARDCRSGGEGRGRGRGRGGGGRGRGRFNPQRASPN